MNRIIEILMERDNMSYDDAQALFKEAKEEAESVIDNDGGILRLEQVLSDYFGLESDYLFDLIDL